jgi:hypothetical protein
MTVGDLTDRLAAFDPDVPVRLAINPYFPMAHGVADIVVSTDAQGQPVVFLAETGEQLGYLPPDIAVCLGWQEPVERPRRQRRGTGRTTDEP